jgi:DNA-binding LacI/PurR family transcriptional regulator
MARQDRSQKEGIGIHSVAAAAKVSVATVSRTINGTAYVSPQVKKRVLQAMEELDYIPDVHVGSLPSACMKLLGLMVSEPIQSAFPQLIHYFEDAAFLQGYAALIGTVNATRRGTDVLIRQMIQQGVDGVAMLTDSAGPEIIDPFLRKHIRLVCLTPHPPQPEVEVLGPDMNDAANQAVQHLAVLGHRDIAFIGSQLEDVFLDLPVSSFVLAMSKIGIQVEQERMVKDKSDQGGDLEVIQQLLEQSPPTAIVCASDLFALKTLRVASGKDLSVPGDLSVVGYGDVSQARHSNPSLTTIRLSQNDLATQAVELLCRPRGAQGTYRARDRGIDLSLVVRDSTSFPRHAGFKRRPRPAHFAG